jgi:hypothetical protein
MNPKIPTEKEECFEEKEGIESNKLIKGFIKEMNNYGFTSYFIGICLAQIIEILRSDYAEE